MFKLNAAHRLLADEIEQNRVQDEADTKDFIDSNPSQASSETTAADTLVSTDPRDTSTGTQASQKLAAYFRSKAAFEKRGAMGDNTVNTDPLHLGVEDSGTLERLSSTENTAGSTVDDPFDTFDDMSIPGQDILNHDQPDVVRGAKKHKPKHPARKHPKKKAKPSAMLERLLDEQSLMYQNEAKVTARSTVDTDSEPGSVHVRFPTDPAPVDGSDYLTAVFQEEMPETLGTESEEGEIHILSSEQEEQEEQEVLGDADVKTLWNVANQPLS